MSGQLLKAARAASAYAGVVNRAGGDSRNGTGTKLSAPGTPLPVRVARMRAIEEVRKAAGISREKLAAEAGISEKWYRTLAREPGRASDRVIGVLSVALRHLREGRRQDESEIMALVEAVYGGFLTAICFQLGLRVEDVRANDPRAGKTADPVWRRQAQARQLAIYLTNISTGVKQRVIARVLGLTPAAICLALKTIEDLRDDPVFDTIIETSARTVTGRSA